MKYILIIILILSSYAFAEQDNYEFFGTNKLHKYNISHFSQQLSDEYGFKVQPFSIVVASEGESEEYRKQFTYLKSLDAENMSLIYISSLTDKLDIHGYHTTTDVAKQILQGINFKVLIYSPDGNVIAQSEKVLTDYQVTRLIIKYNNRVE